MHQSYEDLSRRGWGYKSPPTSASHDELNVGALLRTARALEHIVVILAEIERNTNRTVRQNQRRFEEENRAAELLRPMREEQEAKIRAWFNPQDKQQKKAVNRLCILPWALKADERFPKDPEDAIYLAKSMVRSFGETTAERCRECIVAKQPITEAET